MKILAIIPARMGSSRFPGKPLALINKTPMIEHVYKNVSQCQLLTKTVVATCDKEIADYISSIGAEAVMTSNSHERASDRASEALISLEKKYETKYDIIVMVQGDEPMTHPNMINEAVEPMLKDSSINVVNLYADIKNDSEFNDRNCIKVVLDKYDNAIYFSREPIPHKKRGIDVSMKKQVCIIPFTRDFLFRYQNMSPTPLEIAESIDMMRVLENGYKVRMVHTHHETQAVDTKEDLEKVQLLMSK
jgi:3-deoxy-manno-octulosonate cytidylyltransferase (CMP-KDO synthetase)